MATESILVYVGEDLLGDGLVKMPFIRALRAFFPEARIHWLAGTGPSVFSGPLAPLVAGLLDEVIRVDLDAFVGAARRAKRRFDLVIDTQRGFATAWKLRRLRHKRFISPSTGFLLSDVRPRGYKKPKALGRQLVDLAELAAGRKWAADAPFAVPAQVAAEAEGLLPPGPAYVGLAPGAGGRHKCWPLDKYLELGRRLVAEGKVPVVLLGPAEGEWEAEVRAALPEVHLPLQEAAEVTPLLTVAVARRLAGAVANDAGIGHLLAMAGIPLVSLFGPTEAVKWAPMTERLTVIRAQDFGGAEMERIPVDAVAAALSAAL
ncbi:MAG: glycosyltransferase family 9 protein [Pseudomonadota bacterium]